ncbi:hypothetical protein HF086_011372 [Spodoptera exigua]|uniref:Uncharacterized protein n=1 Tax=Spodoptera exigua TaxID=7107 RepID=A0A922MLF0_SPOEX|nr:hypothetical protein HF086_011372 [Spodoptera exigua]
MEEELGTEEKSQDSAIWIPNEKTPAVGIQEEVNSDSMGEVLQNVLDTEDYHLNSSVYEDGNETPTGSDSVQEAQMTSTLEQEPELPSKRLRKPPDRYGYMCISSTVPASEEIVFSEALAGPETGHRLVADTGPTK